MISFFCERTAEVAAVEVPLLAADHLAARLGVVLARLDRAVPVGVVAEGAGRHRVWGDGVGAVRRWVVV